MTAGWDVAKNMPDLTGKVAIVTGGNTGIGKEIVRALALNNAKVYMASRTESRALDAIADIKKTSPDVATKPGIDFLHLDLMDLKSCQAASREFLEKEKRLDILVNNAGVMANPRKITNDGIDIQFQTNHLGHFAFTYPLLPTLLETSKDPSASVRIVQVTSHGHNFAPKNVKFDSVESVNRELGGPLGRYGQSKLANILFAKELARRYSGERIWSNAVHPGAVSTELGRGMFEGWPWMKVIKYLLMPFRMFFYTPYKGAFSALFAAASPDIQKDNWRGEYIIPLSKRAEPSKMAQDDQLARELWDFSEKLVKEKCGSLA